MKLGMCLRLNWFSFFATISLICLALVMGLKRKAWRLRERRTKDVGTRGDEVVGIYKCQKSVIEGGKVVAPFS